MKIVLFGSRAKGTGRADSDLDILIITNDGSELCADFPVSRGVAESRLEGMCYSRRTRPVRGEDQGSKVTRQGTKQTFREVLGNCQFARLFTAQTISDFGDWVSRIALFSLIAFHAKGSATAVTGIVIAFTIPVAMIGPLAGVLVDRWDLKRAMITSDMIRAVLVMLLPFAQNLAELYLLVFLLSSVSVFFSPAQMSALPLIVNQEQLLVANALTTQTRQLNRIIGPAVAGALVGWFGERVSFFMDGSTFFASALLLSSIVLKPGVSKCGVDTKSLTSDLAAGMRFVSGHRRVRFIIISMSVTILASAAVDALSPIYIRDLLKGDVRLLSLLMSCVAGGTILGALLIGRYGRLFDKMQLVLGGITGIGVGVLILAAASRDIQALGAGFGLGLVVAFVTVPSQTLIQEETPQDLLGRAASLLNVALTVSQLASVGMAGVIADSVGVRALYYSAGLILTLIGMLGYLAYVK